MIKCRHIQLFANGATLNVTGVKGIKGSEFYYYLVSSTLSAIQKNSMTRGHFSSQKKDSTILSFALGNTGRRIRCPRPRLPVLIENARCSESTRSCRYLQHRLQRFLDQAFDNRDKMG